MVNAWIAQKTFTNDYQKVKKKSELEWMNIVRNLINYEIF